MRLRSLHIRGFRNLKETILTPGPGLNAFWGDNAQGKTNFLEAIYVALRGKSFRPYASRPDWVTKGRDEGTHLKLLLEDHRGYEIQVETLRPASASSWDFKIDAKRAFASALRSRLSVVVFSPDDHAIVRQGPDLRRDYLDDVLSDVCPGYVETLDRYEKALKSRNALLKREQLSQDEISSWTNVLAESASQISNLRREIFPEFEDLFLKIGRELFSGFSDSLRLSIETDVAPLATGAFEPGLFLQAFRESWDADRATGWTHRGPHRDDFAVYLGEVDARRGFSQGQARLMALVLRWTHASWVARQRRETPLFLMDDFSSELDAMRRARLLELIRGLEGQIFLTGTDPRMVDSEGLSEYTQYNVLAGELAPISGPL